MAGDIAALIDHLQLNTPDVVGYSLGGGVALHTAVSTRRKSDGSSWSQRTCGPTPSIRRCGRARQVNAAAADFMKETPMYQLYQRCRTNGLRTSPVS